MSKDLRNVVRAALSESLSIKEAAEFGGCSPTTICRYRRLAKEKNISWSELEQCSDVELDEKFNLGKGRSISKDYPDFEYLAQELQKSEVTQFLLWDEYRTGKPETALSYSQFTALMRKHRASSKRSMRMLHPPGKCTFVDFSGRKMRYYDRDRQRYIEVEIFVGVLGHSLKTFACATPDQSAESFAEAHILMFGYFGGVTDLVVPDNLKAAVICFPKGQLCRQFEALADHYSFFVAPARPREPQDKSAAENAVKIAQRWIIARLRNVTFFSLEAINSAIAELVETLNARIRPKVKISRDAKFESSEKSHLKALPAESFEYGDWTGMIKVPPDYHVLVEGHWYSVPHVLVGQYVYAKYTARSVQIFRDRRRICTHERSFEPGHSTLEEHCPPNHRIYHQNTQETHEAWAESIGACTVQLVRAMFQRSRPQLALPSCGRLHELADKFGAENLERAAQRALELRSPTLTTVKSLLQSRRYEQPLDPYDEQSDLPAHGNIRGRGYFSKG